MYPIKPRPLPGFQRLRLFRWMVEDLIAMLGDRLEDFDLDAWFQTLDTDGSRIIPETWPWIKHELIAECGRRGWYQTLRQSFSKAELAHASHVRQVRMGCRHETRCPSVDACVQLIAAEIRERAQA